MPHISKTLYIALLQFLQSVVIIVFGVNTILCEVINIALLVHHQNQNRPGPKKVVPWVKLFELVNVNRN